MMLRNNFVMIYVDDMIIDYILLVIINSQSELLIDARKLLPRNIRPAGCQIYRQPPPIGTDWVEIRVSFWTCLFLFPRYPRAQSFVRQKLETEINVLILQITAKSGVVPLAAQSQCKSNCTTHLIKLLYSASQWHHIAK